MESIGTGAVGEVWRVSVGGDSGETREAAAKLLKPEHADDAGLVERFVRQGSVLSSLRHPSIVRVQDLVVEGDRLAIVMDLVPGGSVRDPLAASGPLPAHDALTLVAEVLDALAAAHARQVSLRQGSPRRSDVHSGLGGGQHDNIYSVDAWHWKHVHLRFHQVFV